MNNKQKIIIIGIVILLIIISSIFTFSPRLVDRVFYRLGFQEQICFPISDKEFQSDNVINIAAVADVGIGKNSIKTLKNIELTRPEIILIAGDLSYTTAKDWIKDTEFMVKEKTYITLGDGDLEEKNNYLEYFGLNDDFYSFDYENIHFVAVSTKIGYISDDTVQLDFIRDDLSKANDNPETEWIVVFMHMPMYSSRSVGSFMDLRNELQPIFDTYEVDLVINGHKHAYERTKPLKFNNTITDNENCSYEDPNGQIYLTVGTGGNSHSPFRQKQPWSVIQNDNDYGFLNLKVLDNGSIIYGEFMTNDGKVRDAFQISK